MSPTVGASSSPANGMGLTYESAVSSNGGSRVAFGAVQTLPLRQCYIYPIRSLTVVGQ